MDIEDEVDPNLKDLPPELVKLLSKDEIRREARSISFFVLSITTGFLKKCDPSLRFEAKQILKKRLKGVLETL